MGGNNATSGSRSAFAVLPFPFVKSASISNFSNIISMLRIENQDRKIMSETINENPLQELLNEIISSLEPLEARSDAIYQFLKAKGVVTDEDFAPFLEQAANAS